jgi:hypothetical protein
LSDVGMASTERWGYSLVEFDAGVDGARVAHGHLIGPNMRTGLGLVGLDFRSPYDWDDQHRDYRIEVFGRQLLSVDEARACPSDVVWTFGHASGAAVQLAAYRARVTRGDGSVHARGDWRPGWPDVKYSYGNVVPGRKNDVQSAAIGLALLVDFQESQRKQPGPVPDFKDPDELRGAVVTAVRAEWKRTGSKPTLPRVARYFSRQPTLPSSTGESLGKRIKRAGLDWEELLEEGKPPA